jgi:hypothetical protein
MTTARSLAKARAQPVNTWHDGGMDEPDIEQLFAPIEPSAAFGVVLSEAREVLGQIHQPVDAELWGSDMLGALTRSAAEADIMSGLVTTLVPAAEEDKSRESLALLRIFGALGSPDLREAATHSAERLKASGIADPSWATKIGAPKTGECWHYADVSGQQESVTMTFSYGEKSHALSVLIDHTRGGRLKDVWVSEAAGLLDKTWIATENDPTVVFEKLEPAEAAERIRLAEKAGEAPDKPDQADDITAHRALLRSRVGL